jgi:hypothetical protein
VRGSPAQSARALSSCPRPRQSPLFCVHFLPTEKLHKAGSHLRDGGLGRDALGAARPPPIPAAIVLTVPDFGQAARLVWASPLAEPNLKSAGPALPRTGLDPRLAGAAGPASVAEGPSLDPPGGTGEF